MRRSHVRGTDELLTCWRPLSHSSIVARECGIPAVLGTGVATRLIPDGSRIRVDGDRGRVQLLDAAQPGARGRRVG